MNMKYFLSFLTSLIFVAGASASSVVHWQGDYVGASSRVMNLPSATDNGGVRTYVFSAVNSLVPTTGYTAPTGRSSTFYGALQNSQASGDPANFGAIQIATQVVDEGSNFRVQGGAGDSTISGMIMFKKENFLNGYDTGTLALSGLGGNMNIYDVNATSAVFRYAVLSGTQWYLSEAVATGNTLFSVADLASGNWGGMGSHRRSSAGCTRNLYHRRQHAEQCAGGRLLLSSGKRRQCPPLSGQ